MGIALIPDSRMEIPRAAAGSRPRLSIVTPSLNQGAFLERTLCSVLDQEYPELEYLVLDGGSTDNSLEILRRHASRLRHWTSGPDRGQSDAINQGWSMATGDVLAWLNSDDYYYPQALHAVGRLFENNPDLMVVWGAIAIVDERERVVRIKRPRRFEPMDLLLWRDVPGQAAAFVRREVFTTIGGPRLDLHYVMDWEFWLRILLNYPAASIGITGQVFAAARDWAGAKTPTAAARDAMEVRRVLTGLFSAGSLPPELQRLERPALARTWWRQSKSELQLGLKSRAFRSLVRAVSLAPGDFPTLKVLRQFARILRA